MQIYFWNQLSNAEKQQILTRPVQNRSEDLVKQVTAIIDRVKAEGDPALLDFTAKYDQAKLTKIEVSDSEWAEADKAVEVHELAAIQFAANRIEAYHNHQLPKIYSVETITGVRCERLVRPIQRVGLYVPGGSAPLVSSVLMQAIPARLANCPVRILATPPNAAGKIDPRILMAAKLCGIHRVFKMGGAQAIAAMAYGTTAVPKVDKIFGPGNAWVAQSKMLVSQDPQGATIDMPAGPSEIMVIADDKADPDFVAADLLSQAEHGPDSQVMLVTFSQHFAEQVNVAMQMQLEVLPRRDIIKKSLQQSHLIVVDNISTAIAVCNAYAPEHLILQIQDANDHVPKVLNAGAIFVGPWAPETVGDYVTGSNHVLPTYGYARTFSGLSVLDFIKFINVQHVTKEGLINIGPYAETLAAIEGLDAHKNAVSIRLK